MPHARPISLSVNRSIRFAWVIRTCCKEVTIVTPYCSLNSRARSCLPMKKRLATDSIRIVSRSFSLIFFCAKLAILH
ncbi:MAG: hypothetical protein MR868_02010 [Lachnospiraceae bacterium]|nr:hypothetical protein [Lachnospiraceae bacterium]